MRTILVCFFIAFHSLVFSQGNLQFNQVLNLNFSAGGSNFAVPAGKVWKIEGVGLSSYQSFFGVNVAGNSIFLKNSHSSYGPEFESFPFWISGGQNVTFNGLTGGVASIIEFNIVP